MEGGPQEYALEDKQNMVRFVDMPESITDDQFTGYTKTLQNVKSSRLSKPKRETQSPEGQVVFSAHEDLVTFINQHYSLQVKHDNFSAHLKLPKQESAALVANRIPKEAVNEKLQEATLKYLEQKLGHKVSCVVSIFETKKGDKAANIQFSREKDSRDGHKVLVEQGYTQALADTIFPGQNRVFVSMQETSRRHECRETILSSNEILQVPITKFDPNKKGDGRQKGYGPGYRQPSYGQHQYPEYGQHNYGRSGGYGRSDYDPPYGGYRSPPPYSQYDGYRQRPPPYNQHPSQWGQPTSGYGSPSYGGPPFGQKREGQVSSVSVYVENIPAQAQEGEVAQAFQRFRNPDKVKLLPMNSSNTQRAAIIYFNDEQVVRRVLDCPDQLQVQGQPIRVKQHVQSKRGEPRRQQ